MKKYASASRRSDDYLALVLEVAVLRKWIANDRISAAKLGSAAVPGQSNRITATISAPVREHPRSLWLLTIP